MEEGGRPGVGSGGICLMGEGSKYIIGVCYGGREEEFRSVEASGY